MGLNPKFNERDVKRAIEMQVRYIEDLIEFNLTRLAEQLVRHAREQGNYLNQTGNLRSSVGYVLYKDGKEIYYDFKTVPPGNSRRAVGITTDGVQKGRQAAGKLAQQLSRNKGYSLIVVAGMEYAAYVEAKGYDVLASAEDMAAREIPLLKAKLKRLAA